MVLFWRTVLALSGAAFVSPALLFKPTLKLKAKRRAKLLKTLSNLLGDLKAAHPSFADGPLLAPIEELYEWILLCKDSDPPAQHPGQNFCQGCFLEDPPLPDILPVRMVRMILRLFEK